MKKIIIVLSLLFLILQQVYLQELCGSKLNEDFTSSELPSGFSELSTTGQVFVSDGMLVMDYSPSPATQLKIDFDECSGTVYINFSFQSERNYFLTYGNIYNSFGEIIAQIILGNNGTKGILLTKQYVESGAAQEYVNMLSGNITVNTLYYVNLEINTDNGTISGNVDGEMVDEAQDIPLFSNTAGDVSYIVFIQQYMYGGDSDRDDVSFDYFQVINDEVNRSALTSAINQANELMDEAVVGIDPGQYLQAEVNAFQEAIDQAEELLADCSASQAMVDQAVVDLQEAVYQFRRARNAVAVTITMNSRNVQPLTEGLAGYNVRIADSPWNYNNPVFREGVKKANVGFLRYFSGTTGDYFDMNTGMYEPQWYEQVHSTTSGNSWNGVPDLIKWQEVKGPSRLSDLYDLLGEVGGKLIITWNAFADSPDRAKNLAKFCKDNNIIVECWQFCNEPNFYVPSSRYFFNDGADYARKMKEFAEAIRSVDPDANIALSYGWDGWGSFAQSIKEYQDSEGAFWTHPSIHSYAVHGLGSDFESALNIAYSKLEERTNDDYFEKIEQRSWSDAKLLITEYGVWNDYLKGTVSAGLYCSEYVTRLSVHPQTWFVGKHQITGAVSPLNNYKTEIMETWTNGEEFNVDYMPNDYYVDVPTLPLTIIYPAINNSVEVCQTEVSGGEIVTSSNGDMQAIFAASYVGEYDKDYMVIINKSGEVHEVEINIDDQLLTKSLSVFSVFSESVDATSFETDTFETSSDNLKIMPYSITRIEWAKDEILPPRSPRIYKVEHGNQSVTLKWWHREGADYYTVHYGTLSGQYAQSIEVDTNEVTLTNLNPDTKYFFAVTASNAAGTSDLSNEVASYTGIPDKPEINYVHEDDSRITIHWESVPFANGYKVKYGTASGDYTQVVDAKNVSGYVLRGLKNDTPYYITVCAYNNSGESQNAEEITATAFAERPWAPLLLNGKERTDGTIELNWQASVNNHGAVFDLYYCPTPWDVDSYSLVKSGITTTSFIDSTYRATGWHFYRVKARNEKGESFFYSNIATIWKENEGNTVGINELFNMEVQLYPNPVRSFLKIVWDGEYSSLQYHIYNSSGSIVSNGILDESQTINVENLVPGVYFIELISNERKNLTKFIKVPNV